MRASCWWMIAAFGAIAGAYACATGSLVSDDDNDASGPHGDATTGGDSAACPQFDFTSDPAALRLVHERVSDGRSLFELTCKATCDSPTTKCSEGDASACVNTSSDPLHAGVHDSVQRGQRRGLARFGNGQSGRRRRLRQRHRLVVRRGRLRSGACTTTCSNGFQRCATEFVTTWKTTTTTAARARTHAAAQSGATTETAARSELNIAARRASTSSATKTIAARAATFARRNAELRQWRLHGGVHAERRATTLQHDDVENDDRLLDDEPVRDRHVLVRVPNGLNYQAVGQYFICGGTTACIGHVGINTYSSSTVCQGVFDVYCDSTNVGTINTVGKTCIGTPMTNGCSISFAPVTCSSIKLKASAATRVSAATTRRTTRRSLA